MTDDMNDIETNSGYRSARFAACVSSCFTHIKAVN